MNEKFFYLCAECMCRTIASDQKPRLVIPLTVNDNDVPSRCTRCKERSSVFAVSK